MPRAKGVWRDLWKLCDRCGFLFPLGQLTKQKSLLVCKRCFDDNSNDRRQQKIAEVLSDGKEGENPLVEKQAEIDEFELEF